MGHMQYFNSWLSNINWCVPRTERNSKIKDAMQEQVEHKYS